VIVFLKSRVVVPDSYPDPDSAKLLDPDPQPCLEVSFLLRSDQFAVNVIFIYFLRLKTSRHPILY
jgi:hypothetical protein